MITQFKIYESSGVNCLDVEHNYCGVCGTEGTNTDVNDMDDSFENYYKCPNCDFEWYSLWSKDYSLWSKDDYDEYEDLNGKDLEDLYSLEGVFKIDGDRLDYDDYIPSRLYNEIKIQANKYNL